MNDTRVDFNMVHVEVGERGHDWVVVVTRF